MVLSHETKQGPVLMKSSVLLDKPTNNSLQSQWKIGVQAAGRTLGKVAGQVY
jgi:hypothetical protein